MDPTAACDDPAWGGRPHPLSHDFGAWSKPRRLRQEDAVKFRVRTCRRCGQEERLPDWEEKQ